MELTSIIARLLTSRPFDLSRDVYFSGHIEYLCLPLQVDEVLPPGHAMPPPRGALRTAIPIPGGGTKSRIHVVRRSGTPVPKLEGRMSPRQSTPTPSAWCENCTRHLVEAKRHALRLYMAYTSASDQSSSGNNQNKVGINLHI